MKIWKNIKSNCGNYNTKFGWSLLYFLSRSDLANKLVETEAVGKFLDKLQSYGVDEWVEKALKPTCAVCLEKMEFEDVTDDADGALEKAIYSCPKDKLTFILNGLNCYYMVEDRKFLEKEIKKVYKMKAFW